MLGLLLIAALLLAWANGSNDNFKAAATLYGSRTMEYRGALTLATAAQVAGSLASVVLAGALLKAFSGKGLVPPEVVGDPRFLVAVGLAGAGTVLTATRFGIPISTTHALIGGLLGAGLTLAPGELAWGALGGKYFMPLAVSPLLALAGAALVYPLTRAMPTLPGGDAAHKSSAFALGFARGLNDTPKVLALLVAAGWSGLNPRASLLIIAAAMAVGGALQSRRVAETLGDKITTMDPGQGLVANSVASTLVIGASLMGSPVSTTHVSTGAIFGIGMHTGSADTKVIGGIVLAWVATLPIAAALAAGIATVL
ncbi:MAG: inorganic phosphate transporter [Proteobacteria bacterium]|nr:inorganic phosphate transporter [Pseudomonadota bacterium]